MEKQTHFNFSLLSRVFVFSLCFLLLFCLVSRPITAHASATATVVLGLAGGASAPVSIPIAAVCLLVVAVVGVVGANLDTIIQTATRWYNESVSLRNWADSVGTQLEEGTVVVIPPDVQRYLQKKANGNKVPDNMPILFVPQSFLSLDTLTQAELVGTDVSGLLGTSNKLLDKVNTRLIELKSNFLLLPSLISNELSDSFASIKDSVLTLPNRVANALSTSLWNIQSSVSSAVSSLHGTTEEMRMQLYEHFAPVSHNIEHMRLNMFSHFSELNTNIKEGVGTNIGLLRSDMTIGLSNLQTAVKDLFDFGATTTPNFNNSMNQSGNAENTLMNQAGGGSDITIHYIGQGKDLISKYRVAFLAVGATLAKFFDIPILADLVTFSLALGVFALVVNLGNTLISKASDSSAKGKRYATAKGG